MIVLAVAFPNTLFLNPEDSIRATARALHNAIWPAQANHEGFAVLEISEVKYRFL